MFGNLRQYRRMMLYSTSSGHKISKQSMDERRRSVYVTVQHDRDRFVSLPKRMPTVWIRRVLIYFTLSQPPRTCWYTGLTSLMRLPKLLPQNRAFTSALIVHPTNGGSNIKAALPSLQDRLSQSSWQCKGTQSLHVFGRNTPTRSYVTLVSPPWLMNHVCTQESSMATGSSSCGRLTILLSQHRTNLPPKS
jgi:hypothetical protein